MWRSPGAAAQRVMGKASFAAPGHERAHPALHRQHQTGVAVHEAFKHWDLGDILAAEGTCSRPRPGELSVARSQAAPADQVAAAPAGEIPRAHDQEQRYRQRYVDLITQPRGAQVFSVRSRMIQAIRAFMVARLPRSRNGR